MMNLEKGVEWGVRKKGKPSKRYIEELKRCKALDSDIDRANCTYELLYDISRVQDTIQLSVPAVNSRTAMMTRLTNNANAILLEVSKWKGSDEVLRHGYAHEKVKKLVWAFDELIHDYNVSHKDNMKGYSISDKKYDVEVDEDTINRNRDEIYGDVLWQYTDKGWKMVEE